MDRQNIGENVTVWGRTTLIDGRLSLLPSLPDGMEGRTDCAIAISGDDLPEPDVRVSVEGLLIGQDLRVSGWEPESRIPFSWEEMSEAAGVSEEEVLMTRASVPKDWALVSSGGAKTKNGKKVVVLHVVRATSETAEWAAQQLDGSVLVYSFVRDAGLKPLLTGGLQDHGDKRED